MMARFIFEISTERHFCRTEKKKNKKQPPRALARLSVAPDFSLFLATG